jgi:2-(1,2-epoxy-1,2-dihydrophenyl)acetyl-CoA isomerase
MTGPLLVEHHHGVTTVTLNRPDKLNALNQDVRRELVDTLRAIAVDPAVRAVVLTGSGRAFCAGQDLAAVDELNRADETVAATYNPIVQAIATMPQPIIAAVNGLAVGAGLGLALACDLRLAADTAGFACAFGKVGLVPDTAATWFLVRELGYARAFEIAATGRRVTAAQALEYGLLNEVVPAEMLPARAADLAARLAECSPHALMLTKRQFRAVGDLPFSALLALEATHQGMAAAHADHREGRAAFTEKRQPRWGADR